MMTPEYSISCIDFHCYKIYGEITLSFTDVGNSWASRELLTSQICFNANRENKILSKISDVVLMFFFLIMVLQVYL